MGDDSKIVIITLFVAITIERKINDGNKLVVVAHFRFKQKERGGNGSKFVVIALFATTTKENKMLR
jgi:hypothetical protein